MARAALILSAALAFIASTSSARVFPAFASPAFRSPLPSVQLSHMRGGSGERMRTQSPAMTSAKIELQDPVAPEPGDTSNVLVIGVAGGSGGGKSVFCSKLENMVQKICPTIVLSHDSYYKNKVDVDRDCGGNWDCPDALHTKELIADLKRLRNGEEVEVPVYDFAANARATGEGIRQQFQPGTRGVLLVEGLMAFHDQELRNAMDMRIYVDCDEDTRFMRRLARDTHPLRGRGRTVADVYSAWARNVKPNHHRFVEPTKRFAHMIIPHLGVFADPGHLLAVGEDPAQLLHEYHERVKESVGQELLSKSGDAPAAAPDGPGVVDVADADSAGQLWPALYCLQAYVQHFASKRLVPQAERSAA